jgi:hypothetical protein
MLPKYVVSVAACLEILVGAALLITPDAVSQLLFGGPADGIGMPWARFAGVGLFGLGLSCARSASATPRSEAAFGLLIFNVVMAALLAWLGFATSFHGVLLWPGAIAHALITVALLWARFASPART